MGGVNSVVCRLSDLLGDGVRDLFESILGNIIFSFPTKISFGAPLAHLNRSQKTHSISQNIIFPRRRPRTVIITMSPLSSEQQMERNRTFSEESCLDFIDLEIHEQIQFEKDFDMSSPSTLSLSPSPRHTRSMFRELRAAETNDCQSIALARPISMVYSVDEDNDAPFVPRKRTKNSSPRSVMHSTESELHSTPRTILLEFSLTETEHEGYQFHFF